MWNRLQDGVVYAMAQLAPLTQELHRIALEWAGRGVIVIIILLASSLVLRFSRAVIRRIFESSGESEQRFKLDRRKLVTMSALLQSLVKYTVYFFAGIMILDEFGVPTASLLAGAGIAGLAIGFGAQNLVKDIITGFFILFEDQFAVGDYVDVAGVSGIVESIGLRVTRIRDFGGQLHIIPNGQIEKVTNYMGPGMRVMFGVTIAYEADVDKAIKVLEEVFQKAAAEIPTIVEGPKVLGVEDLAPSGVTLLVWAKAQAMEQWAVARELKKRIKQAFDENGIEIPYPHTAVVFKDRAGEGRERDGQVSHR